MLILSRLKDESLVIGGNIVVTVNRIVRGKVILGIEAPDDVRVLRGELTGRPKRRPRRKAGGADLDAEQREEAA